MIFQKNRKELLPYSFMIFLVIVTFGFSSLNAQMDISISAGSNNQTFSTCDGFILDSGGQGGPGYSNNEDVTFTICPPSASDDIYVQFTLFSLDPFGGSNDIMMMYDGNSTAAPLIGTYTGFELEGVVNQASGANPSGCLTFRFISDGTGTGRIAGNVSCTPPCTPPFAVSTVVGEPSDSVATCIGEPLDFADDGSYSPSGFNLVSYEWDFRDGNSASGQNATHAFTTPGMYRVKLTVTDENGCESLNSSSIRIYVAPTPSFIGFPSDEVMCIGESLLLATAPETYNVTWTGFPSSSEIEDGCVDDNQVGQAQTHSLELGGFTSGATLDDINDLESICINMEHSFMGDFVLQVQCATGQTVTLHQQGGGGTDLGIPVPQTNVDCDNPATIGVGWDYCFTPTAPQTWVQAAGPGSLPAGDYASVQPLSALLGCPLNDVWTIIFTDNWGADDGTLFSFSINVNPSLYEDIEEFEISVDNGSANSFWNSPAQFGVISNNSNDLTITPTSGGDYTYTYTVIDNFGCENDSTVTITVNENPQAFAGDDIEVCGINGVGQAQLAGEISGGTSSCAYSLNLTDSFGDGWNGNSITVGINGSTTNYTIATGNSNIIPLVVSQGDNITLQFNATGSWISECSFILYDCDGNIVFQSGQNGTQPTTQLQSFTADTFGGVVFSWSDPANLDDPNVFNPNATVTGQETFTLSVYPEGHPLCVTTDQVTVTVTEPGEAGDDAVLDICADGAPVDLFPLLGPNADAGGTWLDPSGNVVTMPYDPATMAEGDYEYQIGAIDCLSSAIIEVNILPISITSVTVTDVDCNSADNGSVIINSPQAEQYSIDNGVTYQGTGTFTNLSPGTYDVVVLNSIGCSTTDQFTVTEPNPIVITSITPDIVECRENDVTLAVTAQGGNGVYNYEWVLNGQVVSNSSTFTTQPQNAYNEYCVTVSENCGSPVAQECMIVTWPADVQPILIPSVIEGCYPVEVTFVNATNSSVIDNAFTRFGDGYSANATGNNGFYHVYETPGVYSVQTTLTTTAGCVYDTTFTDMITVHDYPRANFSWMPFKVPMFDPEVEFTNLSSSDVTNWDWTFYDGTPQTSTDSDPMTLYPEGVVDDYLVTLIVTNEVGCQDSVAKEVSVVSDILLFAPNTFTPDGDKFNETWRVYIDGIDIYSFDLFIYNRWGEVIWESHNPESEWDGTYGGKIVPEGAYIWTLQVSDGVTDKKYEFNGHINVLR